MDTLILLVSGLLIGRLTFTGIAVYPRYRWWSIPLILAGVGLAQKPVWLPGSVGAVGAAMVVGGLLWLLNRSPAEMITDIVLWAVAVTLEEEEKRERRTRRIERLRGSLGRKEGQG